MSAAETLVLTRGDVAGLLSLQECVDAVETAFLRQAEGRVLPADVMAVPATDGGFHVKAAGIELSRRYFAVKVNGNFFRNRERFGMENIQGAILLFDAENGFPLAVLDSIEITILRTGAATAVAARRLARPDASRAAICGCGNQGRVQLRALASVCRIERVRVWDGDFERARRFAEEQSIQLGLPIEAVSTSSEALRDSDVAATCTPSRSFYVRESDLSPGGFLAAVGADSPEKQEIDPLLISRCRLVVDVLEQCASIGELHHAIDAGLLTRPRVHADLAQLVSESRPGRTCSQERFVFDSTGTALEDVAAAAAVYEKAVVCGAGLRCRLGE